MRSKLFEFTRGPLLDINLEILNIQPFPILRHADDQIKGLFVVGLLVVWYRVLRCMPAPRARREVCRQVTCTRPNDSEALDRCPFSLPATCNVSRSNGSPDYHFQRRNPYASIPQGGVTISKSQNLSPSAGTTYGLGRSLAF